MLVSSCHESISQVTASSKEDVSTGLALGDW